MRLSDADRERLFETLKRHAAAGRIGIEELERRVAAVAMAESREQVAELMADLPPLPGESASDKRPRWGRGHGEANAPEPDWRATNERFRDPKTKKVMRVWVDRGGARHYVQDD
jgi:Domain of unknown function (DUF1707)